MQRQDARLIIASRPPGTRYVEPATLESLSPPAIRDVVELISACPRHAQTPLREFPGIAKAIGVRSIDLKDESGRFGQGSFKALGGALAVGRAVQRAIGAGCTARDLAETTRRAREGWRSPLTVTCATDGNHGKSVALGARHFGARCVIFVHSHVACERVEAIEELGAEVCRLDGTYDDAVAHAAKIGAREGWLVVSDTSWQGYEEIPIQIMQGYLTMLEEIFGDSSSSTGPDAQPYTHVFLQAGVGGLAAAVTAYTVARYAERSPKFVVVEPTRAPCLFESRRNGRPTRVEGDLDTAMAMLACAQPSAVAWNILARQADAFLLVDDDAARETVALLASGRHGDNSIELGESGAAGLAGLLVAMRDHQSDLGLDQTSRVLVFGTEGALDRQSLELSVGYQQTTLNGGGTEPDC